MLLLLEQTTSCLSKNPHAQDTHPQYSPVHAHILAACFCRFPVHVLTVLSRFACIELYCWCCRKLLMQNMIAAQPLVHKVVLHMLKKNRKGRACERAWHAAAAAATGQSPVQKTRRRLWPSPSPMQAPPPPYEGAAAGSKDDCVESRGDGVASAGESRAHAAAPLRPQPSWFYSTAATATILRPPPLSRSR